jgi:hypothetical protein
MKNKDSFLDYECKSDSKHVPDSESGIDLNQNIVTFTDLLQPGKCEREQNYLNFDKDYLHNDLIDNLVESINSAGESKKEKA